MEKHAVYDQTTFGRAFSVDLWHARALVLLQAPYLTIKGIERFREQLEDCLKRRVRVCVFIQEPRYWYERDSDCLPASESLQLKQLQLAIEALKSMGVHVSLRKGIHEKLAVIDNSIFWDGSLNILSYATTSERMTRWNSRQKVQEAISRHKLNTCDECSRRSEFRLFSSKTQYETLTLEIIGQRIAQERKSLGLTQKEIAMAIGKRTDLLSCIETGKRNTKIIALIQLCKRLELEVIVVPNYLLPAIVQLEGSEI